MKRWANIHKNVVILVVEQETTPTVFTENGRIWLDITNMHVGPDWTYNESTKTFSAPKPVIYYSRIQIIEKLGDDYNKVVAASKTDIDVEVWLEQFRLKDVFEVTNDSVKTYFQFLVSKGLVTKNKIDSVLS